MEVSKALEQIADIHRHLNKTEVYRGYRSTTIAFTGFSALAAAAAQPHLNLTAGNISQAWFWVGLAAINLAVVSMDIGWDYGTRYLAKQKSMTLRVAEQFLPCLAVGAILTVAATAAAPSLAGLLPAVWALLYSMGIFASRPYLPQGVGWVGLFFLLAGTVLLTIPNSFSSPWLMGSVFGFGQLFLSAVLYWNLERTNNV